jgi:hypothetical protein
MIWQKRSDCPFRPTLEEISDFRGLIAKMEAAGAIFNDVKSLITLDSKTYLLQKLWNHRQKGYSNVPKCHWQFPTYTNMERHMERQFSLFSQF